MTVEPKLNDLPDVSGGTFPFYLRVQPEENAKYRPFKVEIGRQFGRMFTLTSRAENGERVDVEIVLYDGEFHVNVEGAGFCSVNRGYWQGVLEAYKPKAIEP